MAIDCDWLAWKICLEDYGVVVTLTDRWHYLDVRYKTCIVGEEQVKDGLVIEQIYETPFCRGS